MTRNRTKTAAYGILAGCLAFAGGPAVALAQTQLVFVKDGKAAGRIVVPVEPDERTAKAAEWLRDYVESATGAELAIH